MSERIASTRSFISRSQKRVEQARQDAAKAREALAEAVASQEKEEGLLAEGERGGWSSCWRRSEQHPLRSQHRQELQPFPPFRQR